MKSIDICPFQLANELHAGLQELCAHEGFRFAENGVQLHARQASAFHVQFDGGIPGAGSILSGAVLFESLRSLQFPAVPPAHLSEQRCDA